MEVKISEPEKHCLSSEHEPATMKYRKPGVYKHTCPDCGEETIFTVPQIY